MVWWLCRLDLQARIDKLAGANAWPSPAVRDLLEGCQDDRVAGISVLVSMMSFSLFRHILFRCSHDWVAMQPRNIMGSYLFPSRLSW